MLIAIDGGSWANVRGFGRFTRELCGALAAARGGRRIALLADPATVRGGGFPEGLEPVGVAVETAPHAAAKADGARSLKDLMAFRRATAALRPDVVFFPAVYSVFPVPRGIPAVVTFHDTIAESLPKLVFPTLRGRIFWTLKCRYAARRAARVVTVSEASRRDVARAYGLDPASMLVIPEGVDRAVFHSRRDAAAEAAERAALGIDAGAPVILAVGGLAPHKNLGRLIEAFARLPEKGVRLVLVGGGSGDVFHDEKAALRGAAERLGVSPRVVFAGFVPDERLAHLYRTAAALAFPSLLEGFGLPALEAMASGTAVAVSDRGSLPEVVGSAGVVFPAESVEAMSAALGRLIVDVAERERRGKAGLLRAEAYTWEKAAELLLPALDEAAAKRRG